MSEPTPLTLGIEAPDEPTGARTEGRAGRAAYAPAITRGYNEAMGRGVELALTLVVMGGIGWLIDRAAGTDPLFTVIFGILGFAGISAKLWLGYDLEMRKLDQDAVWSRGRGVERPDPADRGEVAS